MAATAPEVARSDVPPASTNRTDAPDDAVAAALAIQSWIESVTWTEETYFALPDSNLIVELSEGRLVIPPLPTLRHQDVTLAFAMRLVTWNDSRDVRERGRVVIAPYPIRLWPGKIREPDVMFFQSDHLDRLSNQYGGPPDLALEVLSPHTRRTDLTEKLAEYAQARLAEYWIAHPDEHWVEVYGLADGAYRAVGRFGPGERAVSALLPGFAVDVAALFGAGPGATR